MNEALTKKVSFEQIRQMQEKGELFHDPNAPEGKSLGVDFWAKAEIRQPKKPRSVHLKLDPDVFDYFVTEVNGKGHLTRMQDVLKAYMNARKAG